MRKVDMKRYALLFSIVLLAGVFTVSVFAEENIWLCPNCGEKAIGNYCSECGEAKPSEEWICTSCGDAATGNFCSNCGTERYENKIDKQRLEGDGFDSPEETFKTYIEGLKNKDLDKMISCFAIETLVKNYDLSKNLKRMNSYQPLSNDNYVPLISDFAMQLNMEKRISSIRRKYVFYQYLSLMDSDQLCAGQPIPLATDSNPGDSYPTVEEFIGDNFATNESMLDNIVFYEEYYNPELVYDNYNAEYEQLVHESYKKIYGPEEIKTIIAKFYSDDEPILAFYEAYRFGDRWYIGEFRDGVFLSGFLPLRYDETDIFDNIQ